MANYHTRYRLYRSNSQQVRELSADQLVWVGPRLLGAKMLETAKNAAALAGFQYLIELDYLNLLCVHSIPINKQLKLL